MKKILLLTLLFALNIAYSQAIQNRNLPIINIATISNNSFEQGTISIKYHRLQLNNSNGFSNINNKIICKNVMLNKLSQQYHFTKVENIFSNVLKDESKIDLHKKCNLDLWFTIEFDKTEDVKLLLNELEKTNLFEVVEPVYKKHLLDANNGASFIPNDPKLNEQWSYNNTGQGLGTVGKDIKLLDAWDIETGNPQVIVAVHDMGVQLNHPDLAQNILPNKSFNFVDNNTHIIAGYHGTHTAGTIAAVNNNGIGVSGIAGGNGNINSGVRIMSMQIFDLRNGNFATGGFAESFVYAANNGAAISSNSWAYDVDGVYELSVIDAIDYFIENGGGTTLQGGLVIFAAGNLSEPIKYFPSSYDRVICVAATNNRDQKASYSTFGNWVDIAAPGGDYRAASASQILSTTVGGNYTSDHGTSMACPHVAGVAALVVSKLLGKASASDVRDILLSTTDNIDSINPNFVGKLGTGRLNAFKALQKAQSLLKNTNIERVHSFTATYNCNTINLAWQKNNSNNNVLIAYSNINDIATPINGTQYSVGNSLGGNSIIVYIGNTSNLLLPSNNKLLHFFKIFSADAANHYSLSKTAEIVAPAYINTSGNIQQNFNYPPLFPTQQWRTITQNNNTTWTHTAIDTIANTGAGDDYSMCMYNYNNNNTLGAIDVLTSPIINVKNTDFINLHFWYAYQYKNTGLGVADSFEVLVSSDCGNTYTSILKKAGVELATSTSMVDSAFYPKSIIDWKHILIDISSYKNKEKIMFAFKSINGKGNNLFLDNINIDVRYKTDMAIAAINPQINTKCDKQLNAAVTLINKGNNDINFCKINYTIDDGNIITTNWNGNLKKEDATIVTLATSNLFKGNHTIKIYSFLPNNINDDYTLNDTLQSNFYVNETAVNYVNEGFEENIALPQKWHIEQNPVDEITWRRTPFAGKNSSHSFYLQNYVYRTTLSLNPTDINGRTDDLFTPIFEINSTNDSAFLKFDYAYALRKMNNPNYADSLQIDFTKDCGTTWQTVWKKAGNDLQTINQTANELFEFFPTQNQWKTDSIRLVTNLNIGDKLQVRFRNTEYWGNNIYLDNIQLYTKSYFNNITQKGYIIYPNPATNVINIQHLNIPTTLKNIKIINSIGKNIMQINYNTNAAKEIAINTSTLASGLYILQMIYTNKTITEKIVKIN